MTTNTAITPVIDIAPPITRPAAAPVSWMDVPMPRHSIGWQLSNFFAQLGLLARPFIEAAIDAWTDRDIEQQRAILNTVSSIENNYNQVVWAYFFVHQSKDWRGERYHPGAVKTFQKMTKRQAQAYLQIFRSQYEAAVDDLMKEYPY